MSLSLSICAIIDYWAHLSNDKPLSISEAVLLCMGSDDLCPKRLDNWSRSLRAQLSGLDFDSGSQARRLWRPSTIARHKDLLGNNRRLMLAREVYLCLSEKVGPETSDHSQEDVVRELGVLAGYSDINLRRFVDDWRGEAVGYPAEFLKRATWDQRIAALRSVFGLHFEMVLPNHQTTSNDSPSPTEPEKKWTRPKQSRLRNHSWRLALAAICVAGLVITAAGYGLWNTYYQRGVDAALDTFDNKKKLTAPDRFNEAWLLFRKGGIDDVKQSREMLKALLSEPGLLPKVTLTLGDIHVRLDELEAAQGYYAIAGASYDQLEEPRRSEGLSRVAVGKAKVFRRLGRLDEAESEIRQVEPGIERVIVELSIARFAENWGRVEDLAFDLLSISNDENMINLKAQAYSNLAYAFIFQGEYEESLKYANKAKSILTSLNDSWYLEYNALNYFALAILEGKDFSAIDRTLKHRAVMKFADMELVNQIEKTRERALRLRKLNDNH